MSTSLIGARGPAGGNLQGSSAGGSLGNKIPKGYNLGRLQNFTPEQSNLFQQLFSQVSPDSYLSKLSQGDESAFGELEAPAMRQFQDVLGQLGNRFTEFAPGAMSSQKGSGFKNAGGQLASGFAQDLHSQRMGIKRQALMDLMGISESLLGQRPQEQFLTQKPKPFWQELLGSLGGGIGSAAGGFGTMGLSKWAGLI
jgi:hypothetical protein